MLTVHYAFNMPLSWKSRQRPFLSMLTAHLCLHHAKQNKHVNTHDMWDSWKGMKDKRLPNKNTIPMQSRFEKIDNRHSHCFHSLTSYKLSWLFSYTHAKAQAKTTLGSPCKSHINSHGFLLYSCKGSSKNHSRLTMQISYKLSYKGKQNNKANS